MMAAEIGDPTGDTGTGAEITAKVTWRQKITGTARYLVADVVEVDTGTTAEAAVREGATVKKPPPPPPRQAGNLRWWTDWLGRRYFDVDGTMDCEMEIQYS